MLYDLYCHDIFLVNIFIYICISPSIISKFLLSHFNSHLWVDGLKEYKECREDEKEWSQRETGENSWRWERSASQWFSYKL